MILELTGFLELTGQFNIGQIEHARKKNQRAKSHKRGVPTAGNDWPYFRNTFFSGGEYVNPKNRFKNRLKRIIREQGRSWKAYKKSLKRAKVNILNNKKEDVIDV